MNSRIRSYWIFILATAGCFPAVVSFCSTVAQRDLTPCPVPIQSIVSPLQNFGFDPTDDLLTKIQKEETDRKNRRVVADKLFDFYIQGNSLENLSHCLGSRSDIGNLKYEWGAAFLSRSVNFILSQTDSRLFPFQTLVRKHFQGSRFPLFRLTGHQFENSPVGTPAGTRIGESSIFMDIEKINGREFYVILIHEMLHAMDDQIFRGIENFHDVSIRAKILTDEPLRKEWIKSGLDIGILAEYRAWVRTIEIYKILRDNAAIHEVPWLEAKIVSGPVYPQLFRSLLPLQSHDPLLALPQIQNEIANLLQFFLTLPHGPPIEGSLRF